MAHWLMKTEPEDYSWDRLVADGETEWTGVRNHQAAANMRAMKLGEPVFFYRSVVEPAIVGVMADLRRAVSRPDGPTGKFVRVKVKPLRPVADEVSLKAIKADGALPIWPWCVSRGCRWCRWATRIGAFCARWAGWRRSPDPWRKPVEAVRPA